MTETDAPPSTAPRPSRRPVERTFHGDTVVDPYAWLLDAEDPEVLPHLEAENAWTEQATAPQEPLRDAIFGEIKERTLETDLSVPVRDGAWWYLSRTEEGKAYPIHCRRPDDGTTRAWVTDPAAEQVVLDPNELAGEGEYLGIGVLDVSPDGHWLAYAIDRAGDEHHALRFRDLRDGTEAPETVADVSYGFAWAADSATCWYTLDDEAHRPDRVLRHAVGTDPGTDIEVFRDDDERFHVSVGASRSGAVVVISAGSAVTSESWLLDAHQPTLDAVVVAVYTRAADGVRARGVEQASRRRGRGGVGVVTAGEPLRRKTELPANHGDRNEADTPTPPPHARSIHRESDRTSSERASENAN